VTGWGDPIGGLLHELREVIHNPNIFAPRKFNR
jgi:hypothetical protein